LKDTYYIREETALYESHKELIKKFHYSKSYKTMLHKYIFGLYDQNHVLIGSAVFGTPMNIKLMKSGFLELRKFVLIDEAPFNSESFFLGNCLRLLKQKKTYKKVVTFADPNKKHLGTIYKATNWKFDDKQTVDNPRVIKYGKRRIHLRQVYQKKLGAYTKNALEIQRLIKTGKAKVIKQKPKLRFVYDFT